jgi:hypothetical protein
MIRATFRLVPTAAAVLGVALSLPLAAGDSTYYKWTDERGTAHHSDKPPPEGVDYEVVSPDSGFKRVVAAEEGVVPLETEPTVGNDFEQVKKNPQQAQQKNPVKCERARKDLEALNGKAKIAVRNDQGETRFLDMDEINIERERTEKYIDIYCD